MFLNGNEIYILDDGAEHAECSALSEISGIDIKNTADGGGYFLSYRSGELTFTADGVSISGDLSKLKRRADRSRIGSEIIIKAARSKDRKTDLTVFDATAGLGEDSFLLASYGFRVELFEYNPVISLLLEDALRRALADDMLKDAASRMTLHKTDSITGMKETGIKPDIVLLDPMFPERQKSGLVKKKLQIFQKIETPCENEVSLLEAALSLEPSKIIIKRPSKGPYLGNMRPSYSVSSGIIRYDCIVL